MLNTAIKPKADMLYKGKQVSPHCWMLLEVLQWGSGGRVLQRRWSDDQAFICKLVPAILCSLHFIWNGVFYFSSPQSWHNWVCTASRMFHCFCLSLNDRRFFHFIRIPLVSSFPALHVFIPPQIKSPVSRPTPASHHNNSYAVPTGDTNASCKLMHRKLPRVHFILQHWFCPPSTNKLF